MRTELFYVNESIFARIIDCSKTSGKYRKNTRPGFCLSSEFELA